MKRYFLVILLLFSLYLLIPYDNGKNIVQDNSVKEDEVTVMYNDVEKHISLDDYVLHVLACEMPALFDNEALKAGAVAIRTYYVYKKINNKDYVAYNGDQCYMDDDELVNKWGNSFDTYMTKLTNVVESTANQYITYDNNIIIPFYFSTSNGYTENSKDVFGSSFPYLVSVDSLWDKNVNSYLREVTFTKSEFLNRLGLSGDVLISDIKKNSSNRIDSVLINNKVFSGIDVRKALGLRSTDFDVDVDKDKIIITTRGYGHGVGMSQYGANEMAKLGYSYKEILKHYYSNTEISKISV